MLISDDGRLTVSPSTEKLLFNDTVRSEFGFTNLFKLSDKDIAGRLTNVMEELSTANVKRRAGSLENVRPVSRIMIYPIKGTARKQTCNHFGHFPRHFFRSGFFFLVGGGVVVVFLFVYLFVCFL